MVDRVVGPVGLRHADLQISPAEAIDAFRTLSAVGPDDRMFLRDALTVSLGKSADEQRRVEDTFEVTTSEGQAIARGAASYELQATLRQLIDHAVKAQ